MKEIYLNKNPPLLFPSKEGTNSFTTLEILHLKEYFVACETWIIFITSLPRGESISGSINFNLSILQSPLLGGDAEGRGGFYK